MHTNFRKQPGQKTYAALLNPSQPMDLASIHGADGGLQFSALRRSLESTTPLMRAQAASGYGPIILLILRLVTRTLGAAKGHQFIRVCKLSSASATHSLLYNTCTNRILQSEKSTCCMHIAGDLITTSAVEIISRRSAPEHPRMRQTRRYGRRHRLQRVTHAPQDRSRARALHKRPFLSKVCSTLQLRHKPQGTAELPATE